MEIKIILLIISGCLFVVHLFLVSYGIDIYYTAEHTGKKICDYCIQDAKEYPCNCKEEEIYHKTPIIFLIPSILILLAILNLSIKNNGNNKST
jgi:hypothetical protein